MYYTAWKEKLIISDNNWSIKQLTLHRKINNCEHGLMLCLHEEQEEMQNKEKQETLFFTFIKTSVTSKEKAKDD